MPIRLTGSNELMEEICKAMSVDPGTVQRIVIDAEWNDPLLVYFEHVGTDEVVKLNWGKLLKIEEKLADTYIGYEEESHG